MADPIAAYANRWERDPEHNFALTCYNDNTAEELRRANLTPPDGPDVKIWGISAQEWREAIQAALRAKLDEQLVPHDHVSEVYVCRACMTKIDPVGQVYPGMTQEDWDVARCPHCGGTDTAWLFADDMESEGGS